MANVTTASMTLGMARDRVFELINEPKDIGQFTSTRVYNELNAAARRIYNIVNKEPIDAERETEAGVYAYELPDANIADGRAHVSGVYIDLELISAQAYAPVDESEDTDTPTAYAILGNTLYLYPTPDGVYELKVVFQHEYTPLTSATDVFPIAEEQVDACIYWAAYTMKLMDEEYTSAGMFKSMYDEAFALATRQRADVYSSTEMYQ